MAEFGEMKGSQGRELFLPEPPMTAVSMVLPFEFLMNEVVF